MMSLSTSIVIHPIEAGGLRTVEIGKVAPEGREERTFISGDRSPANRLPVFTALATRSQNRYLCNFRRSLPACTILTRDICVYIVPFLRVRNAQAQSTSHQ